MQLSQPQTNRRDSITWQILALVRQRIQAAQGSTAKSADIVDVSLGLSCGRSDGPTVAAMPSGPVKPARPDSLEQAQLQQLGVTVHDVAEEHDASRATSSIGVPLRALFKKDVRTRPLFPRFDYEDGPGGPDGIDGLQLSRALHDPLRPDTPPRFTWNEFEHWSRAVTRILRYDCKGEFTDSEAIGCGELEAIQAIRSVG